MSRSYKHTPITGSTKAASEKEDKRRARKQWRRLTHVLLQTDAEVLPELEEVSDLDWTGAKDGKGWFDPDEYPRLLRK